MRRVKKPPLSKVSIEEKKEKARWQRIFRVYGITPEQYAEFDLGHCPICLRLWGGNVKPCIDHDHSTGDIRGVVCLYCNHRIIGRHRDGDLIQRVADYLKAPRLGLIVPSKPKKKRKKK